MARFEARSTSIGSFGMAVSVREHNKTAVQSPPNIKFFMSPYSHALYGQQDKIDEAINTIKFGLLQTDNDVSLLYLLAYAYFVKGSHNEGLEALDQALDADFEVWPDFLDYDKELLSNDVEVMELIERHKNNNPIPPESTKE